MADDKDHDKFFFNRLNMDKGGKKKHNKQNFHNNQLITTKILAPISQLCLLYFETIAQNLFKTTFQISFCWNTIYILKLLHSVIWYFVTDR